MSQYSKSDTLNRTCLAIGILDVKLIVTQMIEPVGNNILGNDTAR